MFMLATISKLAIASDARTTDIRSPHVALTTFHRGSAYREQCIPKKKKCIRRPSLFLAKP